MKRALLLAFVLACTHTQIPTVKSRAAFDLGCDQQKIEVLHLGVDTYGARGCGKRATYLMKGDCVRGDDCQAVMNGGVNDEAPATGSAAPATGSAAPEPFVHLE